MEQTPKEKAQELHILFSPSAIGTLAAKAFALFCVDEIIKANPTELVDGSQFTIHPVNEMVKMDTAPYWQQVKQELQKL